MKIASWNVNSFKMRTEHIKKFLETHQPDVVGLQELKAESIDTNAFLELGYHINFVGQKAYNGVALITRTPIEILSTKLDGDESDTQARFIAGQLDKIRIINLYLPNGNPLGSEKFDYKLNWMTRLIAHARDLRAQKIPFVIMGDFNIIPTECDCYDPKAWENDALFHISARQKFRELMNLGLYDCFRTLHPDDRDAFTFWDYQAGAWPRNHGIRIDHILASPLAIDRLQECFIDRNPRGWDQPSDHTPILARFDA